MDLREFVGSALDALPVNEDEDLTLTAETIGMPPAELETDSLLVKAHFPGRVYHPTTRCDLIDMFADKPTYRTLGLLVFATIFHQTRSHVRLRCPQGSELPGTSITDLIIDSRRVLGDAPLPSELLVTPVAYGYWPSPPGSRHPLFDGRATGQQMPTLTWSNADEMLVSDSDWTTRSVVHGFGEPFAAARLAALFLDIGLPANDRFEFDLEGPAGFQSVSPLSAEARLWVGYSYTL